MLGRRELTVLLTHRFARWQEYLEHRRATPFVLLAVGVDDGKELVLAPGDLTEAEVRQILTDTLIALRERELVVTR